MEWIQVQLYKRWREYPRISLETQVILKPVDNDSIILGWVEDISRGGFKARIDAPLNFKGLFLERDTVIFTTDEDFFRLKGWGEISWISAKGDEAGIRFDELDNQGRKSLEDFLKVCL